MLFYVGIKQSPIGLVCFHKLQAKALYEFGVVGNVNLHLLLKVFQLFQLMGERRLGEMDLLCCVHQCPAIPQCGQGAKVFDFNACHVVSGCKVVVK